MSDRKRTESNHKLQVTSGPKMASGSAGKMYIISTVVCLILMSSTQGSLAKKARKEDQNCTDHLRLIDKCSSMATYSYTTSSNPFPQNVADMKSSCDRIGEGIKCLKVQLRCLHALSRRSINAYTTSRARHSRRLCANMEDQRVSEFLASQACIREKGKLAVMKETEKELISNLQYLATNQSLSWDDRFNQACCAASKYKVQVLARIEPQCQQFKAVTEEMVNSMVGELLETACPDDKRLVDICAKQPVFRAPEKWEGGSLTKAALDVITLLSETSNEEEDSKKKLISA